MTDSQLRRASWVLAGVAALALGTVSSGRADPTRISLPRDVVFEAPDGSPVQITAGEYRLATPQPGLLTMKPLRGEPVAFVAAQRGSHDELLESPLAISGPSADDRRHVALLLPDGTLWEASGGEGGVASRGAFGRLRLPKSRLRALSAAKLAPAPDIPRLTRLGFHELLASPTAANVAGLQGTLESLIAIHGRADIMSLLFEVMRDSIAEQNEDKRYYLKKLEMYNRMNEALADYLSGLVEVSRELGREGKTPKEGDGCGAAADAADAAAGRLMAQLDALRRVRMPALHRVDVDRLQAAVSRERSTLREVRRLLDAIGPATTLKRSS